MSTTNGAKVAEWVSRSNVVTRNKTKLLVYKVGRVVSVGVPVLRTWDSVAYRGVSSGSLEWTSSLESMSLKKVEWSRS